MLWRSLRSVYGLAISGLVCACAPAQGWQRTDVRVCAEDSAAIVCFEARPDQAATARVGDETLVVGECARAPKADAAGSIRIAVQVGDAAPTQHRVRVARSNYTTVELGPDGKLEVGTRAACDGSVAPENAPPEPADRRP